MQAKFVIFSALLAISFFAQSGQKSQFSSFNSLALELQETIFCHTIPDCLNISLLAWLSRLSLTSTTFFTLVNDQKGYIQRKLGSIVKQMWQHDNYEALINVLKTVPQNHVVYKTLCTSLNAQYINREFIDDVMKSFNDRRIIDIYKTLNAIFNSDTLYQTIIITAVHKYMKFEHNICNNEIDDDAIENFIKQLTTLYPYSMKPLFNKTLFFLIGYFAERQYRLNKKITIEQCIEVKTWTKRFQQILVC